MTWYHTVEYTAAMEKVYTNLEHMYFLNIIGVLGHGISLL